MTFHQKVINLINNSVPRMTYSEACRELSRRSAKKRKKSVDKVEYKGIKYYSLKRKNTQLELF